MKVDIELPHELPNGLAGKAKKKEKVDSKLFLSSAILLDFSILLQIFCPGLSEQAHFWSELDQIFFNFNFLTFL